MPSESLEAKFPYLKTEGYRITSAPTIEYNCIAWAIEKDNLVWWPDSMGLYAWPPEIERQENLDIFVRFFQKYGYEICTDDSSEQGFEKIALYVDEHDRGTHSAKQLRNGKWTSKLAAGEDIEHNTLQALIGARLGQIGCILKRRIS